MDFDIPIDEISKHFDQGENVVVVSGKHKGKVGQIIEINSIYADIICNSIGLVKKIKVYVNDLVKESSYMK